MSFNKPTRSRLLILAAAMSLCLMVQGCSTSGTSGSLNLGLAPIPSALSAPCPRPVTIPKGSLSKSATTNLWLADRVHLATCGDQKASIVAGYEKSAAAISASGRH